MSKRQKAQDSIKRDIPKPPKHPSHLKGGQDNMRFSEPSRNREVLPQTSIDSKQINSPIDLDSIHITTSSKGGGDKFICSSSSTTIITHKPIYQKKEKISSFLIKKIRKSSMSSIEDISSINKNRSLQKEYNIIIPGKEQRKSASVKKMAVLKQSITDGYEYDYDSSTQVQRQSLIAITVNKAKDLQDKQLDDSERRKKGSMNDSVEFDNMGYTSGSNNSSPFKPLVISSNYHSQDSCLYNYSKKKDQGGKIDFNRVLDFYDFIKKNHQKKIILIQSRWRFHWQLNRKKVVLLQSYWRRHRLRSSVYIFISTYYRLRAFIVHIRKIKVAWRFIFIKEFLFRIRRLIEKKPGNSNNNINKTLKEKSRRRSKNNTVYNAPNSNNGNSNFRLSKKDVKPFKEIKPIVNELKGMKTSRAVPEPIKSFSLFPNQLQIETKSFQIKAKKSSLNEPSKNKMKSFLISSNTKNEVFIENNSSIKALYYERMNNKLIKEVEELKKRLESNDKSNRPLLKDKGTCCSLSQSTPMIEQTNNIRLTYENIKKTLLLHVTQNESMAIKQQYPLKFRNDTLLNVNRDKFLIQSRPNNSKHEYIFEHINDIILINKAISFKTELEIIDQCSFGLQRLNTRKTLEPTQLFALSIPSIMKKSIFDNSKLSMTNYNEGIVCINGNSKDKEFKIESIELSSFVLLPIEAKRKQIEIYQMAFSDKFSIVHSNRRREFQTLSFDIAIFASRNKRNVLIDSFDMNFKGVYSKEQLANSLIASYRQNWLLASKKSHCSQIECICEVPKLKEFNLNTLQLDNSTAAFCIESLSPSSPTQLQPTSLLSFTFQPHTHSHPVSCLSPISSSFNYEPLIQPKTFIQLEQQKEKSLCFVSCCPLKIIHKEKIKSRHNVNSSILEEEELMNNSLILKSDHLSLGGSFRAPTSAISQKVFVKHMSSDALYFNWKNSLCYKQTILRFVLLINKGKQRIELCKAFIKWQKEVQVIEKIHKEEESILFGDTYNHILCGKNTSLNEYLESVESIANSRVIYMRYGIGCMKVEKILYMKVVRTRFSFWRRKAIMTEDQLKLRKKKMTSREEKLSQCLLMITTNDSIDNKALKRCYFLKWLTLRTTRPSKSEVDVNHFKTFDSNVTSHLFKGESIENFDQCAYQNYFSEDLVGQFKDKAIQKVSNELFNDNSQSHIKDESIVPHINLRMKRISKTSNAEKPKLNLHKTGEITRQKKMKMIKRYINDDNANKYELFIEDPIYNNKRHEFRSSSEVTVSFKRTNLKCLKIIHLSLRRYFCLWKSLISNTKKAEITRSKKEISAMRHISPKRILKHYFYQWIVKEQEQAQCKVNPRMRKLIFQMKRSQALLKAFFFNDTHLSIKRLFRIWRKKVVKRTEDQVFL